MVLEDETLGLSELQIDDTVSEEVQPQTIEKGASSLDVESLPPASPLKETKVPQEAMRASDSLRSIGNPERVEVVDPEHVVMTKREKRRNKEARKLVEAQQLEQLPSKPSKLTKPSRESRTSAAMKQEEYVPSKQSVKTRKPKADLGANRGSSFTAIRDIVEDIQQKREKLASKWEAALPGAQYL